MSIDHCQKSANGTVAGTNLGKDEALALQNQQAWGDAAVCKDDNGDYFVLNGAVDLKITADSSPDDLRLKVVRLKSQTDDMKSDISELGVQIEKDKKTLAELGKSQGFLSKLLHDPVSGFFIEAGTVAIAFGLVTSLAEDALNWSMLNNQASRALALQKLKNQHGCSAPIRGQQAKLDAKRAAVAAATVGGVVVANNLLRGNGGDGSSQVPGVATSEPLPDLPSLDEKELKALYQSLMTEYESLGQKKAEQVKQKTDLENEIIKKGGQVSQDTALDKILGNRTVRLMVDAAAAFGVGSTLVRSRYQTYFKFHEKVEAGMRALEAEAKAQAVQELASGQCQAETVTVTAPEPVKVNVTDIEFSALGEWNMSGLPQGVVTADRGAWIYRYQATLEDGSRVGLPEDIARRLAAAKNQAFDPNFFYAGNVTMAELNAAAAAPDSQDAIAAAGLDPAQFEAGAAINSYGFKEAPAGTRPFRSVPGAPAAAPGAFGTIPVVPPVTFTVPSPVVVVEPLPVVP